MPGIIIGIYCNAQNFGHGCFSLNIFFLFLFFLSWIYDWTCCLQRKCRELSLEYTHINARYYYWNMLYCPERWGHGCFSLNVFFQFLPPPLFFYHGNISWNHQRPLSKFSFIVHLPHMMLLINTAGWKITSCRKKIKTRMISHYIVEYLPSYWNHLRNILECLPPSPKGYVRSTCFTLFV